MAGSCRPRTQQRTGITGNDVVADGFLSGPSAYLELYRRPTKCRQQILAVGNVGAMTTAAVGISTAAGIYQSMPTAVVGISLAVGIG